MMRRIRRAAITRTTAAITGALLAWSAGPWQGSCAALNESPRPTRQTQLRDGADKLTAAGSKSYGYDNAGNLTTVTVGSNVTTLSWDYAGRLSGITYPNLSTNSFTYNDLGQRTTKTDSAGTSASLYDGIQPHSRVLADSRADYTNGGLTGLISERASGTTLTYHGDQLGSTRGLTNGSQAVTVSRDGDAWGNVISSSGALAGPFGFAGGYGYQQDSDSGLMRLGARYYDASVGRFISRDPIRYAGGDPNLYRYCANSPVIGTDPSGNFVIAIPLLFLGYALLATAATVVLTNPGVQQAERDLLDATGRTIGDVFESRKRPNNPTPTHRPPGPGPNGYERPRGGGNDHRPWSDPPLPANPPSPDVLHPPGPLGSPWQKGPLDWGSPNGLTRTELWDLTWMGALTVYSRFPWGTARRCRGA